MIVTKNDKRYFNWLCKMVKLDKITTHTKILNKLNNSPFTYIKTNVLLSRDSSREDDGLELRSEFIEDSRTNITNIEGECSILEMLIALARRIDDLCNETVDNKIPHYFSRLVYNLGLWKYDDDHWNEEEVDNILKIFLTRKYDKNGNGGLFPIPNYNGDMRKIDIAMQMHHYLNYLNYKV